MVNRLGPISLRVSVTDRCSLRCQHCTPPEGLARFGPDDILRYEEILAFVRVIKSARGLAKVHLTGGEPLRRRDVVSLTAMLAGEGVADLAMTTNAQRLAAHAGSLRRAGLARVNVSLCSLEPETFAAFTGGGTLAATLAGIEAALKECLPVKINTTLLAGVNDEQLCEIVRFAHARGVEARFIELMPLGAAARLHAKRFFSADDTMKRLAREFSLTPLARQPGSSARMVQATDAAGVSGRIGLISSCSLPFCSDCNRLRLTADGLVIGCLAHGGGLDVKAILRAGSATRDQALLDAVGVVMGQKRRDESFTSVRCMAQVGG
ncbi:MAG: radical SAM protein [Planctomycetota bacterium]